MADDNPLSYPGVFRPLLHTVEAGSQRLVIRGVTYYFARCGSACLSKPVTEGSLMFAYLPCQRCTGVSGWDTIAHAA
jgi:hypothetical protein